MGARSEGNVGAYVTMQCDAFNSWQLSIHSVHATSKWNIMGEQIINEKGLGVYVCCSTSKRNRESSTHPVFAVVNKSSTKRRTMLVRRVSWWWWWLWFVQRLSACGRRYEHVVVWKSAFTYRPTVCRLGWLAEDCSPMHYAGLSHFSLSFSSSPSANCRQGQSLLSKLKTRLRVLQQSLLFSRHQTSFPAAA